MSDRFKFRAWDKTNDECLKYKIPMLDIKTGFLADFFDKKEAFNRRYTLEQCTGLKDKNGKLIYEGDIVQTDYEGVPLDKYVYRWEAPAFYVEPIENGKLTGSHYYYYAICVGRCTVIGNIHENPELLKEEQ